jgi:hypothetical protein
MAAINHAGPGHAKPILGAHLRGRHPDALLPFQLTA